MAPFAIAILLLLVSCQAQADAALPRPDPPGKWRRITQSDASSDSQCIGRPATVICAADTWIAAMTRGSEELAVRLAHPMHFEYFRPSQILPDGRKLHFYVYPSGNKAFYYRIIRARRLEDRKIPDSRRPGARDRFGDPLMPYFAGDILIDVDIDECDVVDKRPCPLRGQFSVLLREHAGEFRYLTSGLTKYFERF